MLKGGDFVSFVQSSPLVLILLGAVAGLYWRAILRTVGGIMILLVFVGIAVIFAR